LAAAGAKVTHCPCSNQVLASGHCPVCEMEEAGLTVGLGVDGSASNSASNLMQEVRAAFLLQRGCYGVTRVTPLDALRWATTGSAACLGRPELGVIAPEGAADRPACSLEPSQRCKVTAAAFCRRISAARSKLGSAPSELRFAGALDPLVALVLSGAYRADRVMVTGRWVVGAKSMSEAPYNPVAPALANAIRDATGVRFVSIPIRSDRIWQAMQAVESSDNGQGKSAKFNRRQ
jgi:8-oxoguanine deaminase